MKYDHNHNRHSVIDPRKLGDDLSDLLTNGLLDMKPIWNRWQCFLRSVWGGYPFDYYVDGHDWAEKEYHNNCTVTITECEVCGKQDITWKKN